MASLSSIIAASLRYKAVNTAARRVLVPVTTKQFHLSSRDYATVYDDAKNATASAHQKVAKKAEEGGKTMSETAGKLKEKAKSTAEETWDKVKDTTDMIKDCVVGNSQDPKDSIRATAKTINTNN